MKPIYIKSTSFLLLGGLVLFLSFLPSITAANNPSDSVKETKGIKNVILMISDGCGSNQILATDYYTYGKTGTQIYEKFPEQLYMSTYSLGQIATSDDSAGIYDPVEMGRDFDWLMKNPTDSAAAATAMASGVKTYDAAIGVDQDGNDLRTIAEDFESLGKSTGVVSSVPFSHATPASFIAHNANRNHFRRIAVEMIRESATDVIMGGGNPLYDKNGAEITNSNDQDYRYVGGRVIWDALSAGTIGADADGDGTKDPWTLIQTKEEFEKLQTGDAPKRLIGVPEVYETLQQGRAGAATAAAFESEFIKSVPTLEVMANGALNVLDADEDGFFLMIEGGAVDWANHANQSGRMIEEETDFNNSVQAVCRWVEENSSWEETLVIVTADHESGCLTGVEGTYGEVINNGKGEMPGMVWNSRYHTNQLVPFYAKGAGANQFQVFADQTDPIRGSYLDNTDLAKSIRALLRSDIPTEETQQPPPYIPVQILGVNDFHGQLDTRKKINGRFAGGANYLSAYLKQHKEENPNTLIVHAGDMVGGSSPTSSLFQDEPTIEFMNQVGFDVGIPGNHELDDGYLEMMRLINGGYDTTTGNFSGADFPYISANIIDSKTKQPIFDPYLIKNVSGIPIAFIGVTLTDKQVFQDPDELTEIEFIDEVTAINKAVSELKDQHVEAIILLAHVDASIDSNTQKISGDIAEIATAIDDEVDVIFAGHNHNCINNYIDGKLIVESYCNGIAFSDVDLEIDPETKDIINKKADVVITYQDAIAADPEITKFTAGYENKIHQLVNHPIAVSDNLISKASNKSGEAPLGNLIADAQRWKLKTDFAFINSPGIRADIAQGSVTWGELYNVQPFHNKLVKITMTGQQIRDVLNQQFQLNKMLQISGFRYTWKKGVVLDIFLEDGITPMEPSASYTVAVNAFLSTGGDGFTVFQEGILQETEVTDFECLRNYLKQLPQPFSASIENRIIQI